MILPNADRAVVDIAKLRDYCLCADHPCGRHKARVFLAALGLSADHAEFLRDALLDAAHSQDAMPGDKDEYGQRFVLDFPLEGPIGRAQVRSAWIVRADEDFPRFLTCFVI